MALKKMLVLVNLGLVLFILTPSLVLGQEQLTNNAVSDSMPAHYNGTVAWNKYTGTWAVNEILYWDGTRDINDDPIVVKVGDRFSNVGGTGLIAQHDGLIAWCSWPSTEDFNNGHDIYYWNDGATTRLTTNTAEDRGVSVHSGGIAWSSDVDGDYDIYYWDGVPGSAFINVSNNTTGHDNSPSLYGSGENLSIAWSGSDDGDSEIYLWNGEVDGGGQPINIQKITDNTTYDGNPSLYDGTVAWNNTGDSHSEIYYWDGTDTIQITHNDSTTALYDELPSLWDGAIAWEASDPSHEDEIYYWNGSFGTDGLPIVTPLTSSDARDEQPSFSGRQVVWQSEHNPDITTDYELYMASINIRPQADGGEDLQVNVCDSPTISGSGSDTDGTIASYAWLFEYRGNPVNNQSGSGQTVQLGNLVAGLYVGTLTVTDNEGSTGSDSMDLFVSSRWDANDDCQRGLPEVITILQEITGQE